VIPAARCRSAGPARRLARGPPGIEFVALLGCAAVEFPRVRPSPGRMVPRIAGGKIRRQRHRRAGAVQFAGPAVEQQGSPGRGAAERAVDRSAWTGCLLRVKTPGCRRL